MPTPPAATDAVGADVDRDVQRAFVALSSKTLYDQFFNYYDGNQPLVYATDQLAQYFSTIKNRFTENWCAVVIDSALERLTLKAIDAEDAKAKAAIKELNESGLELEAYDAHVAALVCGEAYVIVWREDDDQPTDVYYNDPRQCHLFYKADRPKEKEFAAKWWRDAGRKGPNKGRTHLVLYYPDVLRYFVTPTENDPKDWRGFEPDEEMATGGQAENTFGEVPVFHLRRNRRKVQGELEGRVLSLQDMSNKMRSDMFVTAEFQAFPQRWLITQQNVDSLKVHPGRSWRLEPGDKESQAVEVGQFQAADLAPYIAALNDLANHIGIISRTPKHYFFSQGGDPSGEALKAMEAPLVAKCRHYSELFGAVWRDVATFWLKLQGIEVQPSIIHPVWGEFATEQPETESVALKNVTGSGLPLVTALRKQGWGQDELDQMKKDKDEEKKASPLTPGLAMIAQARQAFNRGEGGAAFATSPTPAGAPPAAAPPTKGA